MALRPYQQDLLNAVKERRAAGVIRQLATLPTGMGKTVCFASMPTELQIQDRMMVLVHRDELATQAAEKIQHWNPNLRVGVEMADRECSANDDIIVAGVQTAYASDFRRLKRVLAMASVDLAVPDEAHHYIADRYKQVLTMVADANPNALLCGYTATPNRGDGQAMAQLFDEIVFQYSMRDGIREGWLADLKGQRLTSDIDLSRVKTRAGDFAQNELSEAVNAQARNAAIVRGWIDYAWPRPTIAFCVDVQHAQDLALEFVKHGIPAAAIWGNDPDRKKKLQMHREGELKVLTNCNILTEGYDDWRVGCIIMARPTKSQLLYIQCAGRGTRIPDGVNNLLTARQAGVKLEKEDCILLDVCDVTGRHSLVTLPSLLGLPPKMDLKSKSVVAVAEAYEEAVEKHYNVDLSTIESIDDIKNRVEQVDLWRPALPPELVGHSELLWRNGPNGSYVLRLPNREQVSVSPNLLGKWDVYGSINNYKIEYTADDAADGILHTEMNLSLHGKKLMDLLRKEAARSLSAVDQRQYQWLRRLGVPEHEIYRMTYADAGRTIAVKMAEKRRQQNV